MNYEKFTNAIKDYHPQFAKELVKEFEVAKESGFPHHYWAEVGSLVINGINVSNGIGDGCFRINYIFSNLPNFEERKKVLKDTGIFFYKPIRLRIYDCLPESEVDCNFGEFDYAQLLVNADGDFTIAIYRR